VLAYVYSGYALCLLLQILLVAALDIKTRDLTPLVQLLVAVKILQVFFRKGGGAPTVRFAPVVLWTKTGPENIPSRWLCLVPN
jgi:hypothetical protein